MSIAGMPYARALLRLSVCVAAFLLLTTPAWAAPANDAFSSATPVGAAPPASIGDNNLEATKEPGEPNHAGDPGGHSVWYSWTPVDSVLVEITACAPFAFSHVDTVLAVYTGSSVGALTEVAANDDGPSTGPECSWLDGAVRFTATAGTTYRIAVDGASGTVGGFTLRVRSRPANDDFANPEALSSSLPTSAAWDTTTQLATKQAGEPNHAGDPGGHSVWYSWTPVDNRLVAINTCGGLSEVDTLLAVYTGSDLSNLAPVAADDGAEDGACPPLGSEVQFAATAGTTYWIAVDGKDGGEGRITLNLDGAPANDAFASAKTLSPGLPTSGVTSTRLATKEPGEPNHADDPGGHSVWFSWTPSSSGVVEISTCPYNESSPDTLLAVYTGTSVGSLTPVAANDDGTASCGEASMVEVAAVADTTYRIAVDGKPGPQGIVSLEIHSALLENDDFGDAEELSPTPLFAGGFTKLATKEPGEPNHAGNSGGHSVWFSWTPTSSGPVDIIACDRSGNLDTLLAIYTGASIGGLTPIVSNDNGPVDPPVEDCGSTASMAEFDAVAGTDYRIAVDGKDGETGGFFLAFARGPANDEFHDAKVLFPGLPVFSTGTVRHATKELASLPTRAIPAATRFGTRGPRRTAARSRSRSAPTKVPSTPCLASTPAPPSAA